MKKKSRDNVFYRFFKRAFDIAASFLAIVVLAIPMLVISVVIVCDSRGPVLYRSYRVGKDGKDFLFLKFRTMFENADQKQEELLDKNEIVGGVTFKLTNDPRITRVGKFLRKYSLDELPQLFCILKGDMSVIGPRPGTPRELNFYDARAMRRLEVKQGLSGEWQVYGRNKVSFSEMVEMDIDYIDNKRSFFYDMKLILVTVLEVIRGNGK